MEKLAIVELKDRLCQFVSKLTLGETLTVGETVSVPEHPVEKVAERSMPEPSGHSVCTPEFEAVEVDALVASLTKANGCGGAAAHSLLREADEQRAWMANHPFRHGRPSKFSKHIHQRIEEGDFQEHGGSAPVETGQTKGDQLGLLLELVLQHLAEGEYLLSWRWDAEQVRMILILTLHPSRSPSPFTLHPRPPPRPPPSPLPSP